jgi:DNA replication protein DnaC
LEDFDFDHACGLKRDLIAHLGTLDFVATKDNALLVIDEVGHIPFEPEAANLFFQLVSSRYERASLIVTSNKPFGRWGEVIGDDVVAATMIDRLVHHTEVVALKGDSYRLKDRDLGRSAAQTVQD